MSKRLLLRTTKKESKSLIFDRTYRRTENVGCLSPYFARYSKQLVAAIAQLGLEKFSVFCAVALARY